MGLRRTKTAAGAAVDRRTRGGESRQHGRSLCELCLRAWLLRRSTQREREREREAEGRERKREEQPTTLPRATQLLARYPAPVSRSSLCSLTASPTDLSPPAAAEQRQDTATLCSSFLPLIPSSPHTRSLAFSPSLSLSLSPCLRSSLRFSLKEEPEPHSCPTASNLHPLASFHASFQLSLSSRPAHPDAQDAGR